MNRIIRVLLLTLLTQYTYAQHVYQIRADSVRIYNVCDTAELIIENRTRGVNGFLYNKGNGRTEFRRLQLETIGDNQIAISGQDTLDISTLPGISGVDTIYRSGDNIVYRKKGTLYTVLAPLPPYKEIPTGTSYAVGEFSANRVTGFNAYNSPDMPAVSDQALINPASGSSYYAGHVAWNGSAGYQMAVNWDGELTGPKGVFIRNKDDTKTIWGAWRELVFKDYADGKYWHLANHAPGIALSPTLSGANVPASFTSNASGHVTGFTTRTLTASDISAAPATGSGSYIQNQISSAQTANSVISGTYTIRRDGSNTYSNGFQLTNAAATRGVNIQLTGDATPGLGIWLTNSAGTWSRRMAIAENGEVSISNIPAWGTAATRFLTVDGQIIKSRTAAEVLGDIGAAPSTGSGNYIHNQIASAQSANGWITGGFRANGSVGVWRDGSSSIANGMELRNAAGTRGGIYQLSGDANPGIATYIHDGSAWQKRQEYFANGDVTFTGALGNISFTSGADTRFSRNNANYITASNSAGSLVFRTGGDNVRMQIAANGDATFSNKTLMPSLSGIAGTGTGTANSSILSFYESNGTTRQGYVGMGSSSNSNLYLVADGGNVVVGPNNTTAATFSSTGLTLNTIPALGTAAATFLTSNGGMVSSRTAAQVRSDIDAAPSGGSANYVHNQFTAAQTGNLWVSGVARANNRFDVAKDGSNTFALSTTPHFILQNNAGSRGAALQLTGDTNPGLAMWLHNGATWTKNLEVLASGRTLLSGAVDDGSSTLLATGPIRSGSGTTGNIRLVPGTASQAGYLSLYNGSNTRLGYIGYDNTNVSYVADGSASHSFVAGSAERMRVSSGGVNVDGVLTQKRTALNTSSDAGIQLWNSLGGSNLYPDPEFRRGYNGLNTYNNAGGTAVQLFRENAATEAAPNYSGYYVRVQIRPGTSNGITPGLGGFTSHLGTAVNQVYVTRIRAKIPSGYNIQFAANAFGTNQEAFWLTDRAGNGKWKDYMLMWRAGNGGTFSSVNYFYIEGAAANIDVYIAYFDTKNTNASHWTDNVTVNHATGRPTTINLNTDNTYLSQGANYATRIGTTHGYVDVGPQNEDWAHFTTDRERFFFNKQLIGTTQLGVYNGSMIPTTFMQQNEIRVNDNVVWHAGNINFATKGSNIALKTEANGYLGIENWIRVTDGTGFYTSSGKYLYNNTATSWAMRSGTGQATSWLELQTGEGTNRGGLYANSSNDIGIVNANANGWRLRTDASGNAYVTGQVQATSFYQSSLRSLKKNIRPFEASALELLGKAQVRTFQFKADTTGKMNIGFIADEVPEEMSIPGRTGVDQASTVALLVKSVQELNDENQALKEELKELKLLMQKIIENNK